MCNLATKKQLIINFGKFLRHSSAESVKPLNGATKTQKSTIDRNDLDHLTKQSKFWWNLDGQFRALHTYNILRIQLIRDSLENANEKELNASQPLKGIKLLDVGCGGGILSEPLARIGANVTGIDASEELILTAQEHAKLDTKLSKNLNYVKTTIEDYMTTNSGTYDAVVASEVLEHVSNQDFFIKCCCDMLKPGGSIFITTLNKTLPSWLAGIIAAEYILQIVPKGTHEWNKFVSPQHVQRILDDCDCKTRLVHGAFYNPLTNQWTWTSSTAVNYAIHAIKASGSA